jgi:DNA polymerase-3 subunit epsilon
LAYLGPFRSQRAARVVMEAIWDAVPIRRCSGPPGRRSAPCAMAQLGVALCPCDGTLTTEEYRPIVDRIVTAIDHQPALLLDPLARRTAALARSERFEEAAWMRDRHQALARCLERRRAWKALTEAGMVWAESDAGEGALIESGRLVAAWSAPKTRPLVSSTEAPAPRLPVPERVGDAEEAHLVWRWLTGGNVRLIDADGPLAMPARAVPHLDRIAV